VKLRYELAGFDQPHDLAWRDQLYRDPRLRLEAADALARLDKE